MEEDDFPSGFRRWSETGREQETDRMFEAKNCIHADSDEPPTKWSAIEGQGVGGLSAVNVTPPGDRF
jgi:hypothetical protein